MLWSCQPFSSFSFAHSDSSSSFCRLHLLHIGSGVFVSFLVERLFTPISRRIKDISRNSKSHWETMLAHPHTQAQSTSAQPSSVSGHVDRCTRKTHLLDGSHGMRAHCKNSKALNRFITEIKSESTVMRVL